jgi:two-component system phosphate regulon sensor histidine kinase PhoR
LKKSYIPALVILISVSMLGLVAIQIYWLRNSIILRDAQFRASVSAALTEVNEILETEEQLYRLSQHDFARLMLTFDSIQTRNGTPDQVQSGAEEKNLGGLEAGEHWYKKPSHEIENRETRTRSGREGLNRYISKEKQMLTSRLRRNSMYNAEQTEEIAQLIFDLSTLKPGSNFLTRTTADQVDSLLKMSLSDNGAISASYHFGIFNSFDDPLIIPERSKSFSEQLVHEGYKVRLLSSDFISPTTFLYLWFPSQESYLIKTLWPLLISSMLFLITIILAFAYTIRTILRQKKVSEIKNDFINNMTHELKTPISTISLACEALNDPSMTKSATRVSQYVGMIKDENKRLGVLVENVLRSAVLDRSEMKLQRNKIDMHAIIETAIKNIELQATNRGGTIKKYLHASNPIISGDQIHLTNVVYNLLDNAIKYSKENPAITVSTNNDDEAITLEVADNGIGITKEDQKRVFEKLFRVHTGNIHNIKGFGLGLSYVKTVAEKHGGSVSVESELGKGSIFRIKLPYNYDI